MLLWNLQAKYPDLCLEKLNVLGCSLEHLCGAHLVPTGNQPSQILSFVAYSLPSLSRRQTLRRQPRLLAAITTNHRQAAAHAECVIRLVAVVKNVGMDVDCLAAKEIPS